MFTYAVIAYTQRTSHQTTVYLSPKAKQISPFFIQSSQRYCKISTLQCHGGSLILRRGLSAAVAPLSQQERKRSLRLLLSPKSGMEISGWVLTTEKGDRKNLQCHLHSLKRIQCFWAYYAIQSVKSRDFFSLVKLRSINGKYLQLELQRINKIFQCIFSKKGRFPEEIIRKDKILK